MTFQELFEFSEHDLQTNHAGRLSSSQQARWQQALSRSQHFQHGGLLILFLVIGMILLGSVRYVGTFFPDISPATYSYLTGAGILIITIPVLLGLNGMLVARRRRHKFEALLHEGQVKRLVGPIQLTRTFYWEDDSYRGGYVYTLSMNRHDLTIYGGGRLDREEFGQALFDVFGLPLPQEQNMTEKRKHVPQVTESREEYIVYYLENGWGQYQVFSIENAGG